VNGRWVAIAALLLALTGTLCTLAAPRTHEPTAASPSARNVVVLVADGLRWQDVFGVKSPSVPLARSARWQFARDRSDDRRRALLPFLWTTIARRGQILGNRDRGSEVRVTNGFKSSYPGYNEMLAGYADPRITNNNFGPNPNLTVLEWLNQRPAFAGRVAAFTTWRTFDDILNVKRSELYVRAGSQPPGETHTWEAALAREIEDYVRQRRPRVLFVDFGETDDWAHEGRFDLVLATAHEIDRVAGALWAMLQRMPEYRDSTAMLLTTDHGRGSGPDAWRKHGRDVEGAEYVWLALMGPDVPPLGARTNAPPLTQAQIAATIAALVGEDYRAAVPRAAPSMLPAIQQ
jgi:hypothetical protein